MIYIAKGYDIKGKLIKVRLGNSISMLQDMLYKKEGVASVDISTWDALIKASPNGTCKQWIDSLMEEM
jgi:hypothetical protein